MSKFRKENSHGWKGVFAFYCTGCGCEHFINTIKGEMMDICWDFNGDLSNPTVSPSILVKHPTGDKWNVCHSFIKDGKIQYLPDCTHDLAGETIDMANVVDI